MVHETHEPRARRGLRPCWVDLCTLPTVGFVRSFNGRGRFQKILIACTEGADGLRCRWPELHSSQVDGGAAIATPSVFDAASGTTKGRCEATMGASGWICLEAAHVRHPFEGQIR